MTPRTPASPWPYRWLTLAAAVVYGPALLFQYLWDDLIWLDRLARLGDPLRLAFAEPFLVGNLYWRPLAELTLYWQPTAHPERWQHGFNIGLHVANLLLLGAVARRAGAGGLWALGAVAAFAFHPAFVEPVAWVSGRFDLLLGFFFLVGAWSLLAFSPGWKRTAALGGAFAAALLVKENGVLFAPAWLLLAWLREPNVTLAHTLRVHRRLLALWGLLLGAWLAARVAVLGGTGGEFLLAQTGDLFSFHRLHLVLATVGAYLRLLLLPFWGLSSLYPIEPMLANPWNGLLGGGYLLFMVALWAAPRTRRAGAVLSLFPLPLALNLNFIAQGFPDNLIQNRYLYPAALALLTGLFASGFRPPLSPFARRAAALLGVAWLAVAFANVRVTLPLWASTESLSLWLQLEHPDNPYAVNMRGNWLLSQGQAQAAIDTVGPVAVKKPSHAAYAILGDAHLALGKCREAMDYFTYAWDMGAFPVEEARGLLGLYRLQVHLDPQAALRTRERIEATLRDDPAELAFARERMAEAERTPLVCKDD